MKFSFFQIAVLIEVINVEEKSDFILNSAVRKNDNNGEKLDAIDHAIGVLVPHGEYSLV